MLDQLKCKLNAHRQTRDRIDAMIHEIASVIPIMNGPSTDAAESRIQYLTEQKDRENEIIAECEEKIAALA